MPILPPAGGRRINAVASAVLLGLALAPASSGAALTTFGSDLSAPANVVQAHQADTAFWQTTFADGRSPVAPAAGQITSFKIKGVAMSNPVAGVPGGETMFHLQALQQQPDGTFKILRSSQAFFVPPKGTDPQTITTYTPENFCVEPGDQLVFNTVGGWDGIMTGAGPYPMGTPLEIFSRVPGTVVSQFEGAEQTNNGDVITSAPQAGLELLMQLTMGSGPDATPLCPGGTAGVPAGGGGGTAPPPPPPVVQKATLPAKQKVTVSKQGKLSVSLFCLPGTGRCTGTLTVMSKGAKPQSLGSGKFDIAGKTTGHATVFLNAAGRKAFFKKGHGRLAVTLVAQATPADAAHRSTLAVTLRKRGS